MEPEVSVVVPSYQGCGVLPRLLSALASQRTRCRWEIVLVLDGSTDGSARVAARWEGRLPLRVIDRHTNLGRAVTLNEGFAAARGAVLIRCDDDLVPGPDYVDRFGSAVAANSGDGVVGLCRNVLPNNPYARSYGRWADRAYRDEAYAAPADRRWQFWGGNCGVGRERWIEVGGYDEDFRGYGWEDVDWGYRLQAVGAGIELDPLLETDHLAAATSAALRFERANSSGAASVRFRRKHGLSEPEWPPGTWGKLVRASTPMADKGLGSVVDAVLPMLPQRTGRRLCALGVEASFARGARAAQASPTRRQHA